MMRQSWEMKMMMMVMTMKSGLSKNLEGDRNEVVGSLESADLSRTCLFHSPPPPPTPPPLFLFSDGGGVDSKAWKRPETRAHVCVLFLAVRRSAVQLHSPGSCILWPLRTHGQRVL